MALIEINWEPSRRDLRLFAAVWFPLFCGIVGGLLWYWGGWVTAATVLWGIGVAVAAAGLLEPSWVRPVFVGWMCAAFPIGWTILHLLLAFIYFAVMTPIGLILGLFRDPMERRLDRSARTYWVEHNPAGDMARYFRQS